MLCIFKIHSFYDKPLFFFKNLVVNWTIEAQISKLSDTVLDHYSNEIRTLSLVTVAFHLYHWALIDMPTQPNGLFVHCTFQLITNNSVLNLFFGLCQIHDVFKINGLGWHMFGRNKHIKQTIKVWEERAGYIYSLLSIRFTIKKWCYVVFQNTVFPNAVFPTHIFLHSLSPKKVKISKAQDYRL